MKMKKLAKLAKSQKKLKRSMRKLGKTKNPAWMTALAAIAGAVATALSDETKRGRMKDFALDTKRGAKRLVAKTKGKDEQTADEMGSDEMRADEMRSNEMPNGMVMEDNAGPV
jgi:predicted Zn-dependent protease